MSGMIMTTFTTRNKKMMMNMFNVYIYICTYKVNVESNGKLRSV